MTKEKHECAETVYRQSGGWGRCIRNGVVFEYHEWWCKQHSPSEVKRRAEASVKKWDDKRTVSEHKDRIQLAERAVIEAAVEWLREILTFNEGSRRVHLTRTIRALLKAREALKGAA